MYGLDRRHAARICNTNLDFIVRAFPPSKQSDCPAVFQVDVALRAISRSVYAADVEIDLLDAHFLPLRRMSLGLDNVELPRLSWSGVASAFKSVQFEQASDAPAFLVIAVFGHRETFGLIGKPQQGPADDDAGEDGGDDGGTIQDEPPPPPPPRCCPNQFDTPQGNQPKRVVPATNAAGAVVGASILCKPWTVEATFNNAPPPCNCPCCEYRQLVRGTMTMTPPGGGAAVDISPVTDYAPVAGPPGPAGPPPPAPVQGVNAGGFVEDTIGDPTRPGDPMSFGRRNNMGFRPGLDSFTPQDYPTPCSYWALDAPGLGSFFPTGTTVAINITFRGRIIDTCNGNAVLRERDWTWNFNQVV